MRDTQGIAPLRTILESAEGVEVEVATQGAESRGMFLSYASADGTDIVDAIHERRRAAGPVDVFLDRVRAGVGAPRVAR